MEAGLEHLSWAGGTLRHVDLLLVVVQPTPKTLLTAERTIRLARQLGIQEVALVANRARPGDDAALEAFARERGCPLLALIPEDEAVHSADRAARCVLDTAPQCSAAQAIGRLADTICAS